MPTITREIQQQRAARAINPPPPPCPQFAVTSCTPVPETPATTLPYPGNMAYYGGPVQVHAKEYLVYWGWGEHGAFPGQQCSSETITEGALSATLACDPDLAAEAQRAVAHFGVTDLNNANIIVIQPPAYSDPNAISQGYCAFHDYTYPNVFGGLYNGIQQGIVYTNMPYQLAINSSGFNVCGENAVNSGWQGKLDGFSIVLGHEMEETVTDPGAEDVVGSSPTYLGGWYDTVDANENGDKCAWVGLDPLTGQADSPVPIPGQLGDIQGNAGGAFAVQSLWSNAANEGTGYCAGAGTDSPLP